MQLETFEMERWQSIWENKVEFNLTESGVHALRIGELAPLLQMMEEPLGYPQTNGSAKLRDLISRQYSGITEDQVLVTNGAAEANFLTAWNLLDSGDEVVMMVPNYMQLWGVARSFGAFARPFHLREQDSWRPDLDELAKAVTKRTKLIAVCNPNNPTGSILSENDMKEICRIAGTVGAWILADEVYRGAEVEGPETPSFWGLYDRLLIGSGLSKAYGLPGLRIGWLIGSTDKIADLWRYKDHTSIAVGAVSDYLAQKALDSDARKRILRRTRDIVRAQMPILGHWVEGHRDLLRWIPPRAGAFGYLHYELDLNSTELAERLRDEHSVLVVPGDHFGMDHFMRLGFGHDADVLREGLRRISAVLRVQRPERVSS